MRLRILLAGETLIYGTSRYASLIAALFLTPIYTRLLSKADYGVMDIFNRWNSFALSVIPLGLFSAMVRFHHEMKGDIAKKREWTGTITAIFLALSFLYVIFMIAFRKPFFDLFIASGFSNIDEIYWLATSVVILQLFFQYCLQILRLSHRASMYAVLSLLNFSLLTGLGFYFVYFGKENIYGFFKASAISSSASLIISMIAVRTNLWLTFSAETARRMLNYSVHFLSVFFLFQATEMLDRFLLRQYYDLEKIGIYSIGTRVSALIMLVTGSMALAWMPRAMEMKEDAGAGKIYRRMFTAYVSLGFVIVSFLIVFRSLILRFFAPGYEEASGIISILSVFNFLMGFVYVFTIGIQLSARTKVVTTSAVAAITTKVILSFVLVGNYGMEGLAWASLAESVVWISFQHYFSQKLHPIPFDYKVLLFLPLFFIMAWLTGIVEGGSSELLLLPLLFILSSIPALAVFYFSAYRN